MLSKIGGYIHGLLLGFLLSSDLDLNMWFCTLFQQVSESLPPPSSLLPPPTTLLPPPTTLLPPPSICHSPPSPPLPPPTKTYLKTPP